MGKKIEIKLFKRLKKLNKDMELIAIIIFKEGIRLICLWKNGNIEMLLILVNKILIFIILPYLKMIVVWLIPQIIMNYKLTIKKII